MSATHVVQLERDMLAPLTEQLRMVLSRTLDRSRRIVDIERAPFAYGSSWWLEEITLHLDDGSLIPLVFKDLSNEVKGSGARRVKPAFVTDASREPWTYRTLLSAAPAGPPRLWAALSDLAAGRYWLFIERVGGAPLTEIGDRAVWCAAARWLGEFHGAQCAPPAGAPLIRHDHEYHRGWLARALCVAQDNLRKNPGDIAREKLARLCALAPMHEHATRTALALRPSLIHGEFYASNVLAEASGPTYAIHPVDWEMAGVGPPLLDLAALTSGRWGADDRTAMTRAYLEGARAAGEGGSVDECLRLMAACRLLLAVQWLGWSAGWTAPPDHRNDWLEEAEQSAEELYR